VARIRRELLPHRRGEPGGEGCGIEAWARDEGEDVTGHDVEQDAGHTLLGAATARQEVLHRSVEAGHCILAGGSGDPVELADDAAKSVDLDLTRPGTAAQLVVLRLFYPALANAKIRQFEQRVSSQLRLGHSSDIANRMRRGLAQRVGSGEALFDCHAGQFGNGDLDPRHLVPG
jgi:hypothetical protein